MTQIPKKDIQTILLYPQHQDLDLMFKTKINKQTDNEYIITASKKENLSYKTNEIPAQKRQVINCFKLVFGKYVEKI